MTKEERIKAINDSAHYRSPFNTLETLAKASDEDLAKLETFIAAEAKKDEDLRAAAKREADEKAAADLKTAEGVKKETAAPVTPEAWLATAPTEIRDLIERQKASDAATRTRLVTQLKTAQKEYPEAELVAMPIRDLERLARIAKVEQAVDYGGLGFPRAAASAEDVFSNPPDGYALALSAEKKTAVN